jgi:hypothetical protein
MSSIPIWERLVVAATLGVVATVALAETGEPESSGALTEIQVTARRLDAARNHWMRRGIN